MTQAAPRPMAGKLRPDRVAREQPAPEAKPSVEDSMGPVGGKSSPLAAPRAAGGPQHRGPQSQRAVVDEGDDFGDTDVTSLLL